MSSISKALGALVGGVVGVLGVYGLVSADFLSAHNDLIQAAILIASSFLGTYFAPPNQA
jgi:hypothetical protein